jgi:hypothetical protein
MMLPFFGVIDSHRKPDRLDAGGRRHRTASSMRHGRNIMHGFRSLFVAAPFVAAPFIVACSRSTPPPTQPLAEAQATARSAQGLGADEVPEAQISLKRANQQIDAARRAMADGQNKRARSLLIRARADAELALAQAREMMAHRDAQTETAADDAAQ